LLAIRSKRVRPHLDDKILTAWNGLMISAFAKGAQVLDEPRYLEAAQRARVFILTRMYNADLGMLRRRYRDGDAAIAGFLDDYAFFIGALLDLYEADFDPHHIETAIQLTGKMRELFEDQAEGAFFSTAAGDSNLVLRMKDDYDGAEPSGNAFALLDLLKLAHFTDRAEYRESAERTAAGAGVENRSAVCRGAADAGRARLLFGRSVASGDRGPRLRALAKVPAPQFARDFFRTITLIRPTRRFFQPRQHADDRWQAGSVRLPQLRVSIANVSELAKLTSCYNRSKFNQTYLRRIMERPGATTMRGNPLTLWGRS
jgi:uncharacterized protein YyaL (SSP411 family)